MKKLLMLIAMIGLLTLAACDGNDASNQANETNNEAGQAASGDASLASRLAEYGITELNIGLVVLDENPEAGRANAEFREALEEALGIPVNEIEGISHLIGLEAMRGGSIDMFMASPFTYLTGSLNIHDLELEFLTTLYNPDTPPASTLIITNSAHTHVNSLADFEGESFAFVDTASMTGFLLPMYEFVSNLDLDHTQMLNPGYFFNSTILSGQHDSSLMAVANGDVTGAAVANMILDNMINSGIVDGDDIKIVHEIDAGTGGGYIVRSDLPQFFIDELRTFFLNFENEAFFENVHGSSNARFVETDSADFQHLRSLMERLEIGMD